MRQWEIYLYPFPQEQPHPVVILSNDERCENRDLPYVNGLLCTSVRTERPFRKRESLLDQADGLDWQTAVRCDFIYVLEKGRMLERRGQVTEARRLEIARKVAWCLRLPLY
jgi:mRNA-degrading endonuclease toxin of MazEF toxin-antitoxin module